jgi:hypothetical protein
MLQTQHVTCFLLRTAEVYCDTTVTLPWTSTCDGKIILSHAISFGFGSGEQKIGAGSKTG